MDTLFYDKPSKLDAAKNLNRTGTVYTLQILCIFFLCEEAKKILNSLQWNEEIAKENFTYENHLKVSKFCSPELELWIQCNWVSYLILFLKEFF